MSFRREVKSQLKRHTQVFSNTRDCPTCIRTPCWQGRRGAGAALPAYARLSTTQPCASYGERFQDLTL
ncbi:hypothetical protein CC2G_008584 [Coprinopsis cinerea AmutBmut pab1-1]|nr:hypothetical protein CC2G_008584 [Coprinopsis cinerea AmutBmut pab1-1]